MRVLILCACLMLAGCAATARSQAVRDCPQCPEMVVVPSGTAVLGAGENDRFRNADEQPVQRIVVRARFAVSRFEITRGEYEAFVRATDRAIGGDCLTDRVQRGNWVVDKNTTFRDPGFTQTDRHPVACVSWDDAKAYVAWLGAQTGNEYRLLTEAEWEYVARAGVTRLDMFPWGDDPADGCPHANGFDDTARPAYAGTDTSGHRVFDPLPCTDGWLNTAPVGSLAANAFGLHDMIGNVAEWVEDCHAAARAAVEDATTPPSVSGDCARRVAKGGSWGTLAHNLRTAERLPYAPRHRDDSIGFRVVRRVRPQ